MSGSHSEVIAANKRTVSGFFEALSAGDMATAAELVDPDGTIWALRTRGRTVFSEWIPRFGRLLAKAPQGITFTTGTMTAEDDRVTVLVESYAEFNDDLVYNNLYHFMMRVVDGKIVEAHEYYDTAHAEHVMGLVSHL